METIYNGWYKDANGKKHLCNAHLSYKGHSIIIDYEWCLHPYDLDSDNKKKAEGLIPFEVYPYENDIYVGYVHTDKRFGKADTAELISILDAIIKNEDKLVTPIKFSMHNTMRLIAILCISLFLGACAYIAISYITNFSNNTSLVKNDNTRDYAYEHYCDSVYEANPDYYLDVLVETDKFQSYLCEHGKWWTD